MNDPNIKINSYKYSIQIVYLDKKKNKNIKIPVEKVTDFAIDYNYKDNTMPVALATIALDRRFRDNMIRDMDVNTITVNIKKKCESSGDDTWVDYIKTTEFKYFINEQHNRRYDYTNQEEERDDILIGTGIVLLPINALKNNKKIKNTNIFDTAMSTIVANFTFPLGKILMQPLTNNKVISQLIVPKDLTTINQCLVFFNSQECAFYDSMYRFFIDFDQSYLIDSSGKAVVRKGENITQVYIDVLGLDNLHPTHEYGMAIETKKKRYYIPTGIQAVQVTEPAYNISANDFSKVTGIDADGHKVTYNIDITGKGNKTATKVINVENNNLKYVKNLAIQYRSSAIGVMFSKNDLDSSVLSMNKEYMLHFVGEYRDKSGRYILNRKREYYTIENSIYRMSTALTLNKVDLNV